MKLNPEMVQGLSAEMQTARRQKGWSYAELARRSRVEQSQAQKICEGRFRSLSSNVLQICSALDVIPMEGDAHGVAYERMLATEVIALWDRTSVDALRLIRLLKDLGEIRSSRRDGTG
ncbi:helix-turn-helix transcriptional regulator [Mesorhizobium sp. M0514]|uniref:helix-turn-helix domain-containing protein n=1 Tax=Mesorhizobium sp. M0514 TaxID=2956955 RepID=UPI0033360087